MAEGRTTYWAKDTAWWRRERVVMLGIEFGAAGPAVIDWLSCEADAQRDQGRVKTGMLAIARGSFANDAELVTSIIERALEIGVLDDREATGPHTFIVRVSGWAMDQNRAAAARRQAARRAESRSVTQSHALSHDVPDVEAELETSAPADPPPLAAVSTHDEGHNEPATGATQTPSDSRPLSRTVTHRHAPSRSVTRSHVKTRPDHIETTPPQPPASGGRQRDHAQRVRDYQQHLEAFLAEHPCSLAVDQLDEWQQIIEQLPEAVRTQLSGSHPHADPVDGTLLIGVTPTALSFVRPRFQSDNLGALLGGRRVEFLACPSLERKAA